MDLVRAINEVPITNGEWEIIDGKYPIIESDGDAVCKLQMRDYDETKANARLISAAPNMLYALQEILEMYSSCTSEQQIGEAMRYNIELVESAVKKALGL